MKPKSNTSASCSEELDPLVTLKETENHGVVVVATKRLEPGAMGLCVFRDPALLVIPTFGSERDHITTTPVPFLLKEGPQMWTDWLMFVKQSPQVQQHILDWFYYEVDCFPARILRNYLVEKAQHKEEEKSACDESYDGRILERIEDFVRFAMVIRFNSVELCPPSKDGSGPGTDFGHGLFEKACKMSHSCKPNCVWLSTPDGTKKEIRAISTIEEGQELTIDYVGQNLEPIPQRRKELWMTKGFICKCDRCSAQGGDDTRRFPCAGADGDKTLSGCPGVHFLQQPTIESQPELLPCNRCGVLPAEGYTQRMVAREVELVNDLKELDDVVVKGDIDDVGDQIESLYPPHDLHCLAEKCYELQGELFSSREDYGAASKAYAKQLQCRIGILGEDYSSQATAFCCERLGDALKHVNVEEAEAAYKRTVRQLTFLRGGPEDPYSKCALKKLLEVQNQLAHSSSANVPHQQSLEGIAAPPVGTVRTKCPCTLCGNPCGDDSVEDNANCAFCCMSHQDLYNALVVHANKDSLLSLSQHLASTRSVET